MKTSIYTEKRYRPSGLDDAKRISEQVNSRFTKWLVSQRYLVHQKDVDHLLSRESDFCDSVILDETERVGEQQRLLLECEQARVKEKRLDAQTRQERYKMVSEVVMKAAEAVLSNTLNDTDVNKLIIGTPYFESFASFAYGQSLDFTKLGSLCALSNSLSNSILDLVNNDNFCKKKGYTVRNIRDAKTAIGFIGIESCRMIFPVIMSKQLLKWSDKNTKIMVPKVWQSAVTTANVTRMRLEDVEYKEPDIGVLLGMMRSIGLFIISNNFTSSFDEALTLVMMDYKEKKMRDEYFSCADVTPKLEYMPTIIEKYEAIVTKKVIETFAWDMNTIHIKNALLEDIEDVPILERSVLGAALAQGKAFTAFDMMDKSNVFVTKHLPYWLAHHQIEMSTFKDIRSRNPGKFEF
ncbi:HDOD domain-containing protein [Moritella dasanensis]|uniref:HDOD domain-containing protein n=1 Tax=Moritella dasanensis TaxID=428031 RepID=UPI0002F2D862|nr:HDOD domain-containing protein [Moritella dasanensis]